MTRKELHETRCLIQTQGRWLLKGKKMKPVPNVPVFCREINTWKCNHPVTLKILATEDTKELILNIPQNVVFDLVTEEKKPKNEKE